MSVYEFTPNAWTQQFFVFSCLLSFQCSSLSDKIVDEIFAYFPGATITFTGDLDAETTVIDGGEGKRISVFCLFLVSFELRTKPIESMKSLFFVRFHLFNMIKNIIALILKTSIVIDISN